jgi:hypothetical protein
MPLPPQSDAQRLRQTLRRHMQRRFPGRLDEATTETIIAAVMACAHKVFPWDAQGGLSPALKAKVNWAVLDWLWNVRDGGRGRTQEDDDLFAQAMFGDCFDAEAINRGMRTLVVQNRVDEFLILTQYMDMAYLNKAVPAANDVIRGLQAPGRRWGRHHDVRDVVLDFYRLLRQQQLAAR